MLTSSPSPERALYAVQVGGRDPLGCRVLSASRRLVGERASLVADVPGGQLLAGTGRPPLSGGWGSWAPWDGWSVWVERAGEETFVFETSVRWSAGEGAGGKLEADGTAEVTLHLHRR